MIASVRRKLADLPFEVAPREARWLVGLASGWSESELISRGQEIADPALVARVSDWVARRAAGEPLAYLAGEREFYGRIFRVDRRVLVPRPETEHLIEETLALDLGPAPRLLDVGTGSGAVAATLALELPAARVTASDRSIAALALAADNCRRLTADVRLLAADLTAGIALERFDAVVSNPPYVATDDPALQVEVRDHEPHLALFAEDHGYAVLERLITAVARSTPAWLVLEIGAGQADRIAVRAQAAGFSRVRFQPDLAGHLRVAVLGRH